MMSVPMKNYRHVRRLPEPQGEPFYAPVQWTPLRYLQIILGMVILLPVRFLLITAICIPAIIACRIVAATLHVDESGMAWQNPWQRFIMKTVMPVCGRLVVWLMGFTWVRTYGHQVSFKEAQVTVLSPHSSIFDSFFTGAYVDGCYMTLKSNLKMPVVGALMAASETITVDEKKKDGRVKDILRKRLSSQESGSPVVIYPEGTVHAGRTLIEYRQGAFEYGLPVQPVVLRLSHDPGWTTWSYQHSIIATFVHTLSNLYNPAEVHFLPVYNPSEEEKADPSLFARNIREYTARLSGLKVSGHTRTDMDLIGLAMKCGLPQWSGNLEYAVVRDQLGVHTGCLADMMKKFAGMKENHDGYLTEEDFCNFFNWPVADDVKKLFSLCDTQHRGKICFREYVVAHADLFFPYAQDREYLEKAYKFLCHKPASNGSTTNGKATNGEATNGKATNGKATNGNATTAVANDCITPESLSYALARHPRINDDSVQRSIESWQSHFLSTSDAQSGTFGEVLIKKCPELLVLLSFHPALESSIQETA